MVDLTRWGSEARLGCAGCGAVTSEDHERAKLSHTRSLVSGGAPSVRFMIVSMRRRRRALTIAVTIVAVLAAISACADRGTGGDASSASSASASTSEAAPETRSDEPSRNDELAAALLPAEAFARTPTW